MKLQEIIKYHEEFNNTLNEEFNSHFVELEDSINSILKQYTLIEWNESDFVKVYIKYWNVSWLDNYFWEIHYHAFFDKYNTWTQTINDTITKNSSLYSPYSFIDDLYWIIKESGLYKIKDIEKFNKDLEQIKKIELQANKIFETLKEVTINYFEK